MAQFIDAKVRQPAFGKFFVKISGQRMVMDGKEIVKLSQQSEAIVWWLDESIKSSQTVPLEFKIERIHEENLINLLGIKKGKRVYKNLKATK